MNPAEIVLNDSWTIHASCFSHGRVPVYFKTDQIKNIERFWSVVNYLADFPSLKRLYLWKTARNPSFNGPYLELPINGTRMQTSYQA